MLRPEFIPRQTVITVGTTNVEVSPEKGNIQRNVITFVNTSVGGQIITLAWGKDAVSGEGIVLYPLGSWSESIDPAFVPSNLQIKAVSSAAGGTLAVHER